MKVSKKQIAKWQKREQNLSNGRVANNLEQEKEAQIKNGKIESQKIAKLKGKK
jgi:hypothetical protein